MLSGVLILSVLGLSLALAFFFLLSCDSSDFFGPEAHLILSSFFLFFLSKELLTVFGALDFILTFLFFSHHKGVQVLGTSLQLFLSFANVELRSK